MNHCLAKIIRLTLATSMVAFTGGVLAQQAAGSVSDSQGGASGDAKDTTGKSRKAADNKSASTLATVTVSGYRASLDKAIDIKRNANAVVDAISAEDIGKFPDTNAAESLAHLPGITVDRQFGEGEKVSINGTDPALNRALLNGQTIASGDWGGNPTDTSGRTFNYTLLSPEVIGAMEVYKSPEARIDEGSIGGTVIIHTRKPLDLPANTLRGSLGYNYNDRSKDGNPRGSVLWSWKNKDGDFGFLTSITHDKADLSRAGIEFFGYTTGAGIPSTASVSGSGNVATDKVPVGINSAYFQQTRERNGIQSALQWRPDDKNEFNLTGLYIKGKYNNYSESRYVCPGCGDLGKITSLTQNNGYITQGTVSSATGQPYAELDANYRKSTVTTKSINLRHDYNGDKWVLTSQVGYTSATGGKDPEYLMKYLLQSGGYDFSYDGRNTAVNYQNGSAGNWGLAASPAGSAPGASIDGKYQAGGIYYSVTKDREKYAQFDASRDLDWGPINQVQMGVKYINHDNGQNSRGNRINTTDAISLSQFNPGGTPSGLFDGLNASGDLTNWPTANLGSVQGYLKSQPQGPYNIDYPSTFGVKEITKDLYAQFNFESNGLRGNFGVRYVDTMDKSRYYQSNDGSPYQLVEGKTHYYKPLPSFNIAYDVDESKVLRFGVSKVIARPRYADLAGSVSLSGTGGNFTGSAGNPNLKPYQSTNFDLAGEWYFAPSSLLSTEVFYRKIGTYIVNTTTDRVMLDTTTGQTNTYSITSPVNASNAKVRGISLMYQQDLGYGFGVQTNYTYSHASTSPGLNMPFLSKNTFNLIPYFEKGPWLFRVNYSWRTPYFTQVGRLNSDVFSDQYKQLDVTASYQVNDWMGLTFSATNLLDSTYYWYNQVKYAPIGMYKNGRTYAVGVNFKL
ncbi:iron complex outermembrane recepter protein [Dyella sp. OK004]|uniref:TonB-dependent receptor n=1 Tax=Dyella sp. OK004 TaxID=1855292 RepID=UPI0008E3A86E|nr:TonB-dependent receptor [Dyella sp. OK004]SFR88203.1 iron complex outermembrane recepter protein [Dyella sp. OK004]